ncbi:MAG TPA: glycosyltransferase family 2 protein [Tabrizicola sp.]|nr:glycosyltransferase family 2 protein [Tabrizicola sp.]
MGDFDLSVIIPAHDEEAWIDRCLAALIAQTGETGAVELLVVANACRDGTVARARTYADRAAARGWDLRVLDLAEGGKIRALNAGDHAARGKLRVYLDADIACDAAMLAQLRRALTSTTAPRYATGTLAIAPARSVVTRAYASVWCRLPFVRGGAVGAGLYAVNGAGRARWGDFPQVISDDTFVRLSFAPDERIEVPARYHWPMVEGFGNLVRVRRRQDAGVAELRRLYPALFANEGKAPLRLSDLVRIALRVPLGFLVYLLVHLAVRLRPPAADWTRGR